MVDSLPLSPGLSVVVPTHAGRASVLARLLASLAESARGLSEPWECIVVDGSPAGEEPVVRALCEARGARYLRGGANAGVKRNLGAAAARYDLLLFVDSDCVAVPELLPAHVRAIRSSPTAVAGVVGLTELTGTGSLPWQIAERCRVWSSFGWARHFQRVPWGPTANLAVRTALFHAVGGFDEETGGEDVSFGLRLTDAGHHLVTSEEARALHERERSGLRQIVRKLVSYGGGETRLSQRFPDRTRIQHSPVLIVAGLGVAGLLLGRGLPLGLRVSPAGLAATGLLVRDYRRRRQAALRHRPPGGAAQGGGGWRPPLLDLVSVLFTWALDAGAAAEAVRLRQPSLLRRRFVFVSDRDFVARVRPGR
jgi:GT2 family glycosyltransferase